MERQNVISAIKVDVNKSIEKMLIPGCSVLPHNLMQTNFVDF